MRPAPTRAILTVPLALVLVGCGATSGGSTAPSIQPASQAPAAAAPANDLLADLDIGGGRTMHILCVGPTDTGKPTVVFESGLGGDAGQWSDVIHALDGTVRTCAYDRAGDGQSPPAAAANGRTTKDQVADLRALLAAAKVEPPYVLVGYSIGGWNALLHADQHPDDVVGAVMVDVRPPAASRRWAEVMPPAASGEPEAITLTRTDPDTFEADPTQNPEGLRLDDSATEVLATRGLGDRPLIVLAGSDTTAITEGFDAPLAGTVLDIWWELQADLAAASTAGRLDKVDGAGHDLPFVAADAVADAIAEVIGS
jgi:pimeloyl-ACP methyl ester carboxylesterase